MTPITVALAVAASISCPSGIVPCQAPPVPPTAIRSPYGVFWLPPARLTPVAPSRTFELPLGVYEPWKAPPGEDGKCLVVTDVQHGTLRWVDCVTQK